MGHVRETARRHQFNCMATLLLSVLDARKDSRGTLNLGIEAKRVNTSINADHCYRRQPPLSVSTALQEFLSEIYRNYMQP